MTTTPTHVEVELQAEDLRQDLVSILQGMEAIRQEELAGSSIDGIAKDEYLHLSYRLASILEGLTDEKIAKKMQTVVEAVDKNQALLTYDVMQDEFWRVTEPRFCRSLDQILMVMQGDEFAGIKDKHHLLNALKYLGSASEEFDERVRICDTILPYHHNETAQNRQIFQQALKKAKIKHFDSSPSLVLKVKDPKKLDEIVATARYLGYNSVQVFVTGKDIADIKKKYPSATHIIDNIVTTKKAEELWNNNPHPNKAWQFMKNFASFTFHYVLGQSSAYTQEQLENRWGKDVFDKHHATEIAAGFNVLSSVVYGGYCLAGLASKNWFDFPFPGAAYWYLPVAGLIHGVIQIAGTPNDESDRTYHRGSIIGTLAFLPLTMTLAAMGDKQPPAGLMEIPLYQVEKDQVAARTKNNYHPDLEQLAQKQLGPEAEENLTWKNDNHHMQGKWFKYALLSPDYDPQLGFNKGTLIEKKQHRQPHSLAGPAGFAGKTHLNRKLSAWTYYDLVEAGPYQKVQALVCRQGERNVLTYIASNDKATDFETISAILANDQTPEQQAEAISQHVQAEYIHLSKFKDGKKIAEPIGYN